MKIDTYKCDVCGIQKKDANHWFEGYLLGNPRTGIQIHRWASSPLTAEVPAPSPEQADAHLCGQECATQWLSKNLL